MIVVQLGFAMMPRGRIFAASGLISGTTKGTSVSMRKAEELSMTTAPAAAADGPYSREIPPPALKSAMSTPTNESCVSSSTTISLPRNNIVLPAERAEANSFSLLSGKFRCSRQSNISTPTAPVAPTIATWGWFILMKAAPFYCRGAEHTDICCAGN